MRFPEWRPLKLLSAPFKLLHADVQQSGAEDVSGIENAAVFSQKTNADGTELKQVIVYINTILFIIQFYLVLIGDLWRV